MNNTDITLIEYACIRLMNRFALLNDAMRYEELAQLFTADAAFARPTAPDDFIQGRDNILQAFLARPRDKVIRHVITNTVVDVIDAEIAKGTCYAVQYTGSVDKPADKFGIQANTTQFVGEFYDEFALTDSGWKISRRSGKIIFTVQAGH